MSAGDLITPGLTLCGRCRTRDAAVALSDPGALTRQAAEPELLCFDCLELELEHEHARAISPHAAAMQALARGELERPFHLPDATEAMIERLSTPADVQARRRCRAILPSGARCGRRATVAGRYTTELLACDTHRTGARTPGLGWTLAGEARGLPVPLAT